MLPEYLFDNVAEYFEFLSRYRAEALDDGDKDILITFTIVFLSPGYVNNPFMKAKLVHVGLLCMDLLMTDPTQGLSNGLIPQGYWRKGPLFDRLDIHPLSTQYLMPTLIRFFIGENSSSGQERICSWLPRRRNDWRSYAILGQIQLQTRHQPHHKSHVEQSPSQGGFHQVKAVSSQGFSVQKSAKLLVMILTSLFGLQTC